MNYGTDDHSARKTSAVIVILGTLLAAGVGVGAGIATHSIIGGLMLAIGVFVLALLIAIWVVGERSQTQDSDASRYMGAGIAIGAGLGVAYGVVLSALTENPAFLSIGISLGVSTGVAIGAGLSARNKRK